MRGMISSGEVLRSKSGRVLSRVPTINVISDRTASGTLSRVRKWLLDEARQEALATKDEWMGQLLSGLGPKNLSPSDMDMLNDVLFGDTRGPGPEHRVPNRLRDHLRKLTTSSQLGDRQL